MVEMQVLEHFVRSDRSAEESGLCGPVAAERDGQRVVLFIDWAGW